MMRTASYFTTFGPNATLFVLAEPLALSCGKSPERATPFSARNSRTRACATRRSRLFATALSTSATSCVSRSTSSQARSRVGSTRSGTGAGSARAVVSARRAASGRLITSPLGSAPDWRAAPSESRNARVEGEIALSVREGTGYAGGSTFVDGPTAHAASPTPSDATTITRTRPTGVPAGVPVTRATSAGILPSRITRMVSAPPSCWAPAPRQARAYAAAPKASGSPRRRAE